jgi:hypothetical protein
MSHLAFPALLCQNCALPIPLPPATHPDMFQGQGSWPKGVEKRNFLCTICRHVYEYSAAEVQLVLAPRDLRKKDTPYNVVSILLPCGERGCASLLRIRIVVAADKDPRERVLETLPAAQAHAIHCDGKEHILSGSVLPFGTAFDAMLDEDWKISGLDYP